MEKNRIDNLKEIVQFAYEHTAFYKKLYDHIGIDVYKFNSIEELPIITPQDLEENSKDFRSDEKLYKAVMTSGTVSSPKILYRTQADFEKSVENECIFLKWAGVNENDVVCIIQPFGINGYGELTLEACKKLGVFAIPLGDVDDDIVIAGIKSFSPTILDISPSRLIDILEKMKSEKNSIRLAMIAGEQINSNYKREIKNRYNINVINQYGSTELDCLAAEKIGQDGLHLVPNDFIFEVIRNQLVVTSLYHKGTPLIRYKIGDVATISGDIISIQGRTSAIQIYDGVILESDLISKVVEQFDGIFWQVLVYNKRNVVCVNLYIYGYKDVKCSEIRREIGNSLDFEDLIESGKLQFSCIQAHKLIGNNRKKQRLIDARHCKDAIRMDLVKAYCFEAFYYSLPQLTSKYINELILQLERIEIEILIELGIYLTKIWNKRSRKLNERLWHICYSNNSRLTLNTMEQMAMDSNWEIREEAAKVMSIVIINEFEIIQDWIKLSIDRGNEYIRRAILVAIKYCVEYDCNTEHRKILMDFMDKFLFDKSPYVRKSFDSFTIGDGFLNVCPNLVEEKINSWKEMSDVGVHCSIIRIFKSSGGTKTWPLAKKYLSLYESSDNYFINKALKATQNYLNKKINK